VPIDPEKVTTYELGLKTSQLDGRLRANVALFYNDYQNYQASISNPIIGGVPVLGSVIVNAGKAKTYGAEFDAQFRFTQRLDAQLALTYLKTEFVEFSNPTGNANSNLTGQELPNAPRFLAGLGLNYKLPLASGGVVRLNGSARYQTDSYSDISTNREFTKYPSQSFVDVGAAYTTADGLWTAFATIKNLFDKQYVLPGIYRPDLNLYGVTYNKERQFLIGVRRDF
jgi:iron complex outermembrane receptor protein